MRTTVLSLLALMMAGLSACTTVPQAPPVAIAPEAAARVPLILISIDGFRPDYLDRGVTPNLKALADKGARAAMRPSFPSSTFPNHYTLVTGLRPDHHGIVDNTMRDPRKPDVTFKMSNKEEVTDEFWWSDAKPFWVSAQTQGLKVATLFWPGSEAPNYGVRPTYWLPYNNDMPHPDRVAQVLAWVDLPKPERPDAYTLYYSTVDSAGHEYGPDSSEVDAALKDVDASIGQLIAGLKARGLEGKVNIIVVADHGMAPISKDRAVFLEDYLPRDAADVVTAGPVMTLNPKPGYEAQVTKALIRPHDHMQCWPKAKIPARLHYGTHIRVPEIVCMAQVRWLIAVTRERGIGYKGGAHGYDPDEPEMAALFIASGPDINSDVKLKTFDNVAVYGLIMKLLKIAPEAYDGSTEPFTPALKPH